MSLSQKFFRRNLRRERNKQGWSQHELSEKAGFHRNFVGMLERGERGPSLETLDTLAHVLGIHAYELLLPPDEEGNRNA